MPLGMVDMHHGINGLRLFSKSPGDNLVMVHVHKVSTGLYLWHVCSLNVLCR